MNFPKIPSNLDGAAQKWGREVESLFNELLDRVRVLENKVENLGRKR